MTPILELRNVRKAYGRFVAVNDVSMAVPAGSIFGLLGPNGAGKTSSIRMIMNITAPDSGEVTVFRDLLLDYRSKGKSVVLSTHGMELAERMCDHICLISHGRAVLDGELKAIKRQVGGNNYRLVADGDLERLKTLPEVEQATVQDGVVKLMLRPEAQVGEALRRMVEFLNVHELRSEEPELEQIFLKAVRDAA